MTYKWEAMVEDLTEERDRLLKENGKLREAILKIKLATRDSWIFQTARAALAPQKIEKE